MNSKKIIILTSVGILLCGSLFFLANRKGSTKDEVAFDPNATIPNFKAEEKLKTVSFKTVEEMADYAEKINSIQSAEEGVTFITNFLEVSANNIPEETIGYFYKDIRDFVYQNKLLPVYDNTGSLKYSIKDISVSQDAKSDIHNYTAKYTLELLDSKTNEKLATLRRVDKFSIIKQYERIYITDYSKKTTKEVKHYEK